MVFCFCFAGFVPSSQGPAQPNPIGFWSAFLGPWAPRIPSRLNGPDSLYAWRLSHANMYTTKWHMHFANNLNQGLTSNPTGSTWVRRLGPITKWVGFDLAEVGPWTPSFSFLFIFSHNGFQRWGHTRCATCIRSTSPDQMGVPPYPFKRTQLRESNMNQESNSRKWREVLSFSHLFFLHSLFLYLRFEATQLSNKARTECLAFQARVPSMWALHSTPGMWQWTRNQEELSSTGSLKQLKNLLQSLFLFGSREVRISYFLPSHLLIEEWFGLVKL